VEEKPEKGKWKCVNIPSKIESTLIINQKMVIEINFGRATCVKVLVQN
jgi:hypothetical protein